MCALHQHHNSQAKSLRTLVWGGGAHPGENSRRCVQGPCWPESFHISSFPCRVYCLSSGPGTRQTRSGWRDRAVSAQWPMPGSPLFLFSLPVSFSPPLSSYLRRGKGKLTLASLGSIFFPNIMFLPRFQILKIKSQEFTSFVP